MPDGLQLISVFNRLTLQFKGKNNIDFDGRLPKNISVLSEIVYFCTRAIPILSGNLETDKKTQPVRLTVFGGTISYMPSNLQFYYNRRDLTWL